MSIKTKNQGSYRHARRRAERVPEVAERQRHNPVLAALTPALVQAANAVVVTHDDLESYASDSRRVLLDARSSIEALHGLTMQWSVVLRIDVPGTAHRRSADKRMPDDVLVGSKLLLDTVRTREASGTPLPYAAELMASVEPALQTAQAANDATKTIRATLTAKRRALSEAVTRMHVVLVAYRRILRSVVGSEHPDYRALVFRPNPRPPVTSEPAAT